LIGHYRLQYNVENGCFKKDSLKFNATAIALTSVLGINAFVTEQAIAHEWQRVVI